MLCFGVNKNPKEVSTLKKIIVLTQWGVTFFSDILNNLFLSPRSRGIENLFELAEMKREKNVSVIFIMNHTNANDAIVATAFFPPVLKEVIFPLTFPTKQEWFKKRWKKYLVSVCGCVPIGDGDLASIKNLIRKVKNAENIFIFPEGKVSLDGKMNADLGLLTALSKHSDLLIQPIRIGGLKHFWDIPNMLLRKRKISIVFGKPFLLLKGSKIDAMVQIGKLNFDENGKYSQ
jgi:1-acyl-sn-glycerol-3-phosphate acyltransferase